MKPQSKVENRKSLLLRACRCEPVERVPVWIMRQAGRYLPEYRAIRKDHKFLEVCKTPDLAVEVSMQPYRILGVDAVIVFSDILIAAEAMGLPVALTDAGPVIATPIRTPAHIDALAEFDPEIETGFLTEAIRRLCRELGPDIPVLGFAGAPWTLACYMVEGHGKDGFPTAKAMLYSHPNMFRSLLEKIAHATAGYLRAQIAAGATAVQLFDSWVGELTIETYREYVLPATQLLIEELNAGDTPVILYTKASQHLIRAAAESGATVLSVDWRADLGLLRQQLGNRIALQGNVDPCILLGSIEGVEQAARECVAKTGGLGHILNLGHGILQQTPVENAQAFVTAGQNASLLADAPLKGAR